MTWRIDRGFLVAPRGRGKGYLRIKVTRTERMAGNEVTVRVSSEVANFYPMLGLGGRLARFGAKLYRFTQLKIHVIVTQRLPALARPARSRALARRSATREPLDDGQPRRSAVSSRSFARSCRAWIRRTVPERERIASDSVVAAPLDR